MTATRDSDRTLRAWLDLMPDEAPARVFEAVLDEIDLTPQARRPWLAGRWRIPEMPRLIVAGAAVVLALVIGAIALQPRTSIPNVGASPTPRPTSLESSASSPTPSASALANVPSGLQHRWMGANNGLVAAGAGSTIAFGSATLDLAQSNSNDHPVLTANAAAVSADQVQVTATGTAGRCDPSDKGTYKWSVSSSGRVLTLTTVADPCSERASALGGTWWLIGCKNLQDDCLGSLDAGTYVSQFVNMANPGGTNWSPAIGAVTYTVPAGWANDADWPAWLGLTTQTAYANWSETAGDVEGIAIDPGAMAESAMTPCSGKADPTIAHNPASIVASFKLIPGLVVGDPGTITVDGRQGIWVDLSLKDADVRPCGSDRVVEYLVSGATTPLNIQALLPGHRNRLILVPGPTGVTAIVIDAETARFDTVVGQALPIIASLKFQ